MYGGSNLWGENPSQKKRKKAAKSARREKDREISSSSMSSMDLSFAIQGKKSAKKTGILMSDHWIK